jgi:hypothetical protein
LAVTERHEPVVVTEISRAKRRVNRLLAKVPGVQVDPYAVRESSIQQVNVSRLRINHHAVRSRQEFAQKVTRHGPIDARPDGSSRLQRGYFGYHDRNEVDDPILLSYAPRVRERLA